MFSETTVDFKVLQYNVSFFLFWMFVCVQYESEDWLERELHYELKLEVE